MTALRRHEQPRRLGYVAFPGQDSVQSALQRSGICRFAGEESFEEWGDHWSWLLGGVSDGHSVPNREPQKP